MPILRWFHYIKLVLNSKKPGVKAIILDSLLSDVFINLLRKYNPDFSNLFLNSGAHIQHHYLFNSQAYRGTLKNPSWYCKKKYDPLILILKEYDYVIGKLIKRKNTKLIVATGLHQQPHEKLTFYWRLKDHANFLNEIGINSFSEILPRMSRDFLVKFNSKEDAIQAEKNLNNFFHKKDDIKIFRIDNRADCSLFIELVYPNDIKEGDSIYSKKSKFILKNFKKYIAFVAIKNGEHNGIGYLTSNFDMNIKPKIKLSEVKSIIEKNALNK